jgi:hypothetical protein
VFRGLNLDLGRGDRLVRARALGKAQEQAGLSACQAASRLDAQQQAGDLLRSNGIARRGEVAVVIE